jgi:tetratricopeptide (TPR) repeat protein
MDLTRAITLDSLFTEAYLQRGIISLKRKDIQQTLSDLTVVLTREPGNGQALFHRGIAHLGRERFTEALSDLLKAHSIDPERKETVLNLSRLYSHFGKRDSAQYYFDLAEELR